MAIRTLEEINCDFISERPANTQKPGHKPFTPRGVRTEFPKKMKPGRITGRRPGDAGFFESRGAPEDAGLREMRSIPEDAGLRESRCAPDDEQPCGDRNKNRNKKSGILTVISDTLFSLAILMILLTALFTGAEGGAPRVIFGYSYFTVLSPSMQDEIPQGSFILVKHVDPRVLETGDNITYMADRTTSVTHKIVGIYENYNSSGARGFQTQGVNNASPDRDIVYEAYVVGKVVLVIPIAGTILSNLGENVFLIFIIFSLCIFLSFLMRGMFTRQGKPTRGNIVKEAGDR